MKKFTIFTAALALMASASCVKETIAPETVEGDGVSFTASREDFGGATKTQLVNGCQVEWLTADKVGVYNGNGDDAGTGDDQDYFNSEAWKKPFEYVTSSTGKTAVFTLEKPEQADIVNGKSPYLLVHPTNWNYFGLVESNSVLARFWLADQPATPGTYNKSYGYCAAKTSDLTKPVVFKNLLPLLKFTVPASLDGRITMITVTGNNSENVAGNMLCDYTGDEPKVYVFSEFKEEYKYKGGRTSVALTSGGMAAGNYYLAIAPKTYSKGLKVTVTYKDNKTSTRSSSASVTLESGVIYDMGNVGAENYDGPGIALPYVFSFFAKQGTENYLKYVTGTTVIAKTHYQLNDSATGSVFDMKTSGTECNYWSNKWYGQDNVNGKYFTGENTYFMLTAPLRASLPSTFRVSFSFWVDGTTTTLIKDWKVQYSKDNQSWYDGASFELQTVLKPYSVEITPTMPFSAGETLYLKWVPVKNGTTDGNGAHVHFVSGVVITDVTSPDSKATGNVYAEDFDRINGGVDYRHAGQTNGIEKLGQLGEIFGDSIENWTAEQKNGLSGSYVAERPGYVQIGYATYLNDDRNAGATDDTKITKYVGSLVTPALEKASGTINLSFKAMCYRSPYTEREKMSSAAQADVTDIVVNIKGAGSFDASSNVTSKTLTGISTSKFDKKTLTIYNSDATTQIEFTSTAVSGKFTRWFLDDICVSK